jgi:hypothetical protein
MQPAVVSSSTPAFITPTPTLTAEEAPPDPTDGVSVVPLLSDLPIPPEAPASSTIVAEHVEEGATDTNKSPSKGRPTISSGVEPPPAHASSSEAADPPSEEETSHADEKSPEQEGTEGADVSQEGSSEDSNDEHGTSHSESSAHGEPDGSNDGPESDDVHDSDDEHNSEGDELEDGDDSDDGHESDDEESGSPHGPFPRQRKAKHWHAKPPAPFPIALLFVALVVFGTIVRCFGTTELYFNPPPPFDTTCHDFRTDGAPLGGEKAEVERLRIQLRMQEVQGIAVARGDSNMIAQWARQTAREAEAVTRAKKRDLRARRAHVLRERMLAKDREEDERTNEEARLLRAQAQTLTLDDYGEGVVASMTTQVRRKVVMPTPVDPPVWAGQMWVP